MNAVVYNTMDSPLNIRELLCEVFAHIDRGSGYKAVCAVCTEWREIAVAIHPTARVVFANHLMTLLKLFPAASWNYDELSKNPHLTWEYVAWHSTAPWDWGALSCHAFVTWDVVMSNLHLPWVPRCMVENPNISPQVILSLKFRAVWAMMDGSTFAPWQRLHYNPALTWEFILKHIDENWNWRLLSTKQGVTTDIITAIAHKPLDWDTLSMYASWDVMSATRHLQWCWYYISRCVRVTQDVINANPDIPWNWNGMSDNPNTTWDRVKSNITAPWNWGELSNNSGITLDDIMANPSHSWNWSIITSRHDVSPVALINCPHWPRNWVALSYNRNVTVDIIAAHPAAPWFWPALSRYVNLRNIMDNPGLEWNWKVVSGRTGALAAAGSTMIDWDHNRLSRDSTLTWRDVASNPTTPWDWAALSRCVDLRIIMDNPDLTWDWRIVSGRSGAFKTAGGDITLNWDYGRLSHDRTLTWCDIAAAPTAPWNWAALSRL